MSDASSSAVERDADHRWRLLPFSDAPMGRQLALGEAMLAGLAETGLPALRWYIPRERALVLGAGQRPDVADREALRAGGIALYKRASGGTAVLVDDALVSLDIALPHTHPLATGDVVRAYEWVGELWVEALRDLGACDAVRAIPTTEVRAIPALERDDPLRLACYGTLSPWEVVIGSPPRKVVGLCQTRRRPGALYQIGVYLRFDAATLAGLLALGAADRATLTTRLGAAVAGLDEVAAGSYDAPAIIGAFERALARRHDARIIPGDWLPVEREVGDRAERERFSALA